MANITNSLVKNNQKPKFSVAIQSEGYKNLINNTLGDPKVARKFVADITTVVSNNPNLSKCDAGTILSAGLMAQSLNLPLHQGLGFAYLVPYGDKAQFILGYKGYIQLAFRANCYSDFGAEPVYEGEFVGYDKHTRKPIFEFNENGHSDEEKPIGFMAYLEYKSGIKKAIYMTREECEAHGRKYSKAYNSFWGKDEATFQNQAIKTVIRKLISKYGMMSTEMMDAYRSDMGVLDTNGNVDYVDNDNSDLFVNENAEIVEEATKEETTRQQTLVL